MPRAQRVRGPRGRAAGAPGFGAALERPGVAASAACVPQRGGAARPGSGRRRAGRAGGVAGRGRASEPRAALGAQSTRAAGVGFMGSAGRRHRVLLVSIVVSIPACHAGDRGSIPRRGARGVFLRPHPPVLESPAARRAAELDPVGDRERRGPGSALPPPRLLRGHLPDSRRGPGRRSARAVSTLFSQPLLGERSVPVGESGQSFNSGPQEKLRQRSSLLTGGGGRAPTLQSAASGGRGRQSKPTCLY